ncbi:hypothetical protein ALC60_02395 [Trachymyrmex zeteki]|uniref:Uncharacterized protein n=1 Tax=Mycetomoellerius zeteki TaxID=64791 RepID=A0A151XEH8_9HYME|nr:hypothetical protein ALC60_02395 [Trachymyrmex zeteki]
MLSEEREKICSLFCKDNENQKESAELIREEEKERERYCEKMENREEREARVRSCFIGGEMRVYGYRYITSKRHYDSGFSQDFRPRPFIGERRKTSGQDFLPDVRRPLYAGSAVYRGENSWWPSDQNEGGHAIRERDNNGAVAGELVSRIAGCLNMAGYLKAAGATCASTGNPHQYHPHGHPMGVGTHPHPHSHPHPGAHPGLPSHFALTPHAHTHHALEHGLAAAFPQGKTL